MSKVNDGGPAFPFQALGSDGLPESSIEPGMSLRDWLAEKIIVGLLANDSWCAGADRQAIKDKLQFKDMVAAHAYVFADAMIAAREATHG